MSSTGSVSDALSLRAFLMGLETEDYLLPPGYSAVCVLLLPLRTNMQRRKMLSGNT